MSELNRQWWDERVPIHVASDFYDVEGFKAGRSALLALPPGARVQGPAQGPALTDAGRARQRVAEAPLAQPRHI